MSKLKTELSIIIPVLNEVDNVSNLFDEIVKTLPESDYQFEVIFVDDGSTDGTADLLKKLALNHSVLRVLIHKKNVGQSAALVTGGKAAKYDLLVTMDGDGQNDPADIPRLLGLILDDSTVVLGNRKKRDDNYLRKLSSKIGNAVRQWLLHDECPDTGCSLKIFPRQAFLDLPHFNHLHRFLPALFKRAGLKLINVDVNHRSRKFGTSKYGITNRLFVGIHDLFGVRWLLKRPCTPEVSSNEY